MNKILPTLCLLFPLSAVAAGPGYTYGQGSIAHVDVDGVDNHTSFQLAAGLGVSDQLYVYGDYTRADLETRLPGFPGDLLVEETTEIANLGMGYRMAVSPITDLNFEAGWIGSSGLLEPRLDSKSNDGVRLGLGVRSTVAPFVELGARAGYTHQGPTGNDYFLSGNVLLKMFGPAAINLEALSYAGDVNIFTAGLRIGF